MNILHESCLVTAAPAATLVGLAIFFCISAVILFALSIEAGNYPAVVRWIARLRRNGAGACREHGHEASPDVSFLVWHAFAGGYDYDRAA
jgi:hypothetical protein